MKRIQRKRTKGFRLPPNTKCITRPGWYGNPFLIERKSGQSKEEASQIAVDKYRTWLKQPERAEYVNAAKRTLSQYDNLACWCALDLPCHADVWIEILEAKEAL